LPPGSIYRSSIRAPPPPSEPAPPNQPTVRLGVRLPQISKFSNFVVKYLTAWILVMRNFSGSWCMCVIRYICIPAEYLVKSFHICIHMPMKLKVMNGFSWNSILCHVMKLIDMIQLQLMSDENNILCMNSYMHVCANSEH
jgi:hypothetical protein